ncbi:hypothetical protein ACWDPV_22710 [Gordonia sp. NPDC003504]
MMQGNGADMENIVAVDQDSVVDAVVALNPAPRETRWGRISLCVLDAVWSIAAHYDRVVDPLVRAFAEANGIERPVISVDDRLLDDPCPSSRLASLDVEALLAVTNRQRTSTRSGITKAEASIRYAEILSENSIETLADASALLTRPNDLNRVDTALAAVPGDGMHGVRRGYLWMLVGDSDRIKPDRMILKWFGQTLGHHVDPTEATVILRAAAPVCSERLERRVTAWDIDHAIWLHARAK